MRDPIFSMFEDCRRLWHVPKSKSGPSGVRVLATATRHTLLSSFASLSILCSMQLNRMHGFPVSVWDRLESTLFHRCCPAFCLMRDMIGRSDGSIL